MPVQRGTVPKERNLLAHAPKHLHDEIKADCAAMVHAEAGAAVLAKRKAFLAKWRLRCRPVATSLEEAGERLSTFRRYRPEPWRSVRTTNAIERLPEGFKRRIKTQCLLPCAETAANAVLGAPGLGSAHPAQGRGLAEPCPAAGRA